MHLNHITSSCFQLRCQYPNAARFTLPVVNYPTVIPLRHPFAVDLDLSGCFLPASINRHGLSWYHLSLRNRLGTIWRLIDRLGSI